MRVAYVCSDPGVPAFGTKGASVHVQAVLRALVQRGAEVHLATARTGGEREPDLAPVVVHPLPRAPRHLPPADREAHLRAADAAAADVLDRLHRQQPLTLVFERYALWGGTATRWAAAHGVPSLLEVNAPLVEEQAAHRVLVDRAGAERNATATLSAAGAVLCVSEPVAAWARRHATDSGRVHVLANGVDTARVRPLGGVAAASADPFTVGFVGSLKPWHGVETLVEAFEQLAADPAYRLLLVGDGPMAGPVRARLARAGLAGRSEMTGAVPHRTVPSLLARMDAAVAPYPDRAGFYFSPLKLYEYLAAGVPVVATRVGDLADVLDHGRLGVLVEPADATALAEAVALLRADAPRRARLRRDGRAAAVREHDWSRVVNAALSFARVARPATTPGVTGAAAR